MKTGLLIALAVGALALLALLYHHRRVLPAAQSCTCAMSSSLRLMRLTRLWLRCSEPWGSAHGRRYWDPHFLYPQPAQDIQGAVFTIRHGHRQAYWINTSLDINARHFQYAYVIPEAMVVLIDVRFSEIDAANTKVNVAYERTAVHPEFNEHVKEMGNTDRHNGKAWGTAINDYLAKQRAAAH